MPSEPRPSNRPHALLLFALAFYLTLAAFIPTRALGRLLDAEDGANATYRAYGIARNTADLPWRDGWGLTYTGTAGIALAFTHLLWLLAGGVLVCATRGRWLWLGIALVLAWTLLWTANAVYMELYVVAPTPEGIPHALGLILIAAIGVSVFLKQRKS
jgi:hypothetical protein